MWINKHAIVVISIVYIVLVTSCAGTSSTKTVISSFKDPEYAASSLGKIMILVPFEDLALRKQAEHTMATKINQSGAIAVPSMEILLPTRTYSEHEALTVIHENNIDRILIVSLRDTQSHRFYWKFKRFIFPHDTLTYYFTLKLFDVESGNIIWMATSTTKGVAKKDLMESLSSATVKKLEADGLLN
jgi:PBP1b-binding outer membrane lipoprotein LpoB